MEFEKNIYLVRLRREFNSVFRALTFVRTAMLAWFLEGKDSSRQSGRTCDDNDHSVRILVN